MSANTQRSGQEQDQAAYGLSIQLASGEPQMSEAAQTHGSQLCWIRISINYNPNYAVMDSYELQSKLCIGVVVAAVNTALHINNSTKQHTCNEGGGGRAFSRHIHSIYRILFFETTCSLNPKSS